MSISLSLNENLNTINRKTDSLFDWMGTWGGMHDGLHTITELLLELLSVYQIKAKLLLFIKYLPSSQSKDIYGSKKDKFYSHYGLRQNDPKRKSLIQSIFSDFTRVELRKAPNFLIGFFG